MTAEPALSAEPADVPPPTPAELRRAMGAFATGVTVITAVDGGEPVGFTCQSFVSVSLEPPLMLFCADHRSRSWPRIRAAGRFCVNVLAEDQAEVCLRFGSGAGNGGAGSRYDGLDWAPSRWGAPALGGVLLRVHAEVAQVHPAGDHDVVIGRILEVETVSEARPLIFFRGRFGVDPPEARAQEHAYTEPDPWGLDGWGWG
jgi:flavin reductase (DIM6/NTAB) family NADH-FMN oxidoreductase RutF